MTGLCAETRYTSNENKEALCSPKDPSSERCSVRHLSGEAEASWDLPFRCSSGHCRMVLLYMKLLQCESLTKQCTQFETVSGTQFNLLLCPEIIQFILSLCPEILQFNLLLGPEILHFIIHFIIGNNCTCPAFFFWLIQKIKRDGRSI